MALFLMSSCCLGANRDPRPEAMAAAAAITTRAQAEEAARAPGIRALRPARAAAAWSPNPANPPLFLDLPVKDGKVRPDIVAKWVANAPNEMVEAYAANLNGYYAVAIEIGTKDGLLAVNRQLHEKLTRLRVAHAYEEYDGDHTNKLRERIGRACCRSSPRTSWRRSTRPRRSRPRSDRRLSMAVDSPSRCSLEPGAGALGDRNVRVPLERSDPPRGARPGAAPVVGGRRGGGGAPGRRIGAGTLVPQGRRDQDTVQGLRARGARGRRHGVPRARAAGHGLRRQVPRRHATPCAP